MSTRNRASGHRSGDTVHQRARRWPAHLAVLSEPLSFAYVMLVLGASLAVDGGMFSDWSQTIGVVLTVPAVLVVVRRWMRSCGTGPGRMHDPLAFWSAISVLLLTVSLVFSVYRWSSMLELCKGIGLVGLFWFARTFLSRAHSRRWVAIAVFCAGTLLAVAGLLLYALRASPDAAIVWLMANLRVLNAGRLSICFGYANTLAAFLLMPIGIGMGLAVGGRSAKHRLAAGAGTGLMIAALMASASRGGLLMLLLLVMAAPVLLVRAVGTGRTGWRWLLYAYGGLTVAAAIILVVPDLREVVVSPIVARIAMMLKELRSGSTLDSTSLGGRLTMALDALRYAQEYPVLGSGAGTYDSVYMRFRTTMFFSSDPHSILLSVLTETGAMGLIVFGGIVVTTARRLWSAAMAQQADRPVSVALVAGCVALLLHACIDWDFAFLSLPLFLVVVCGAFAGAPAGPYARPDDLVVGGSPTTVSDPPPKCTVNSIGRWQHAVRPIVWSGTLCWAVVSIALMIGGLLQAIAMRQSATVPARSLLRTAAIIDPLNAEHAFQRARIGVQIDAHAPAGPLSDGALDIRSDFGRAIRLNRYFPLYRIEYGRFLLGYRLPEAIQVYQDLTAIDPSDPGTYTGLALAYLTVYDNPDLAEQWIQQALTVDPKYGEAHLVRGMLLERIQDYDTAATEYRQSADLDSTATAGLMALGAMRQTQGNRRAALRAYWEAYLRAPDAGAIRAQLETLAPVVRVVMPAEGLTVTRNQTVTIRWTATGRTDLVEQWTVYVVPAGGDWIELTSEVAPAEREYQWQIPLSVQPGQYQFMVYALAPSQGADAVGDWLTYGCSGWFTVR
jgi:O-antigen ligase/tetratricopeptide (TPR) repeat protein